METCFRNPSCNRTRPTCRPGRREGKAADGRVAGPGVGLEAASWQAVSRTLEPPPENHSSGVHSDVAFDLSPGWATITGSLPALTASAPVSGGCTRGYMR